GEDVVEHGHGTLQRRAARSPGRPLAPTASVPAATAAVPGDGLDGRVLAPLPQLVVDGGRGGAGPPGEQLDGVHAAGADLDLLGAAGLQQLAPLDAPGEVVVVDEDPGHAEHVGDEVVRE